MAGVAGISGITPRSMGLAPSKAGARAAHFFLKSGEASLRLNGLIRKFNPNHDDDVQRSSRIAARSRSTGS